MSSLENKNDKPIQAKAQDSSDSILANARDGCDILIPVFNAYESVRRCINSLIRHTKAPHRIIVLDDASTDIRLVSWLNEIEEEYHCLCVISSSINQGFIRNVNRGFAHSDRDVVVLNSDTQVTQGWLEKLLVCRASNPQIGIVCPLSNNATILSVPQMNQANSIPQGMDIDEFATKIDQCSKRNYSRIPVAVGFCMLITRHTLDKIGYFDDAFKIGYGEECDFSLRAWHAQIQIACCDDAFVFHEGEASFHALPGLGHIQQSNTKLLLDRWPGYRNVVSTYCHVNPLREIQERIFSETEWGSSKSQTHILQVIHSLGTIGGTQMHTWDLVNVLNKTFRITVLYPGNTNDAWMDMISASVTDNIRLLRYRENNVIKRHQIFGFPAELKNRVVENSFEQLMAGGDYAVVHFQHLGPWGNLQLPIIAKRHGSRVILTLHDFFLLCPVGNLVRPDGQSCGKVGANATDQDCIRCLKGHSNFNSTDLDMQEYILERNKIVARILEDVETLVAPSDYVADKFSRAFGEKVSGKIKVILHGINPMGHCPPYAKSLDFTVAILSNLNLLKGVREVIKILYKLKEKKFVFKHFGLVEPGYKEELKSLNVVLCGAYRRQDLPELLADIDLVLVPSIEETFCLTISEAQNIGIPVIAFRVGATVERIIDGKTGFLVDDVTAEAMTARILEIQQNPESLRIVRNHLLQYRAKSISENAEEYKVLYEQAGKNINPGWCTKDIQASGVEKHPAQELIIDLLDLEDRNGSDKSTAYGTKEYKNWLEKSDLNQEIYRKSINLRKQDKTAFVLLIALTINCCLDNIKKTLASIAKQGYVKWHTLIISFEKQPDTITDPKLSWLKVNAVDKYQRAINLEIQKQEFDFMLWIYSGDTLATNAFESCVDYFAVYPKWELAYVDEDKISQEGKRYAPKFKPDLNVDLLRSQAYTGYLFFARKQAVMEVGGLGPYCGAEMFDLTLSILDKYGAASIGHIPRILYHRLDRNVASTDLESIQQQEISVIARHLKRNNVDGQALRTGFERIYRVDYKLIDHPLVSIILFTMDNPEELHNTLLNIASTTGYQNYEILVVDCARSDRAAEDAKKLRITGKQIKFLRIKFSKNKASLYNTAVQNVKGKYLVFIHDEIRVNKRDWLNQMLALCQQPDISIVSPCVLSKEGDILFGYNILGLGNLGIMDQPHQGSSIAVEDYMGRNVSVQSCSVVSDRVVMIKRTIFDAVGKFDEKNLSTVFPTLSLCMKIIAEQQKIVWTPHVQFSQQGGGSLMRQWRSAILDEDIGREVDFALQAWLPFLAGDPNYNPQLSLRLPAWVPDHKFYVPWDSKLCNKKCVIGFPDNQWATGYYRVIDPLNRVQQVSNVECALFMEPENNLLPNAVELERLKPDALLFHNALHDQHLFALPLYKHYNNCFTVFSLDDLITNLPATNPFRDSNYTDMESRLERALAVSDRLLVTTERLAESYRHLIADIKVIPNYLPKSRWGGLTAKRNNSAKPRIGWAGAMQHRCDLEWLLPVVQQLEKEADWVFFGMCPEQLKPYVKEVHPMVPFKDYPAKLSDLALDVAIAPLQINDFNQCKSNLRVLECGILAYPMICTDIEPYHGAPVTLLKNDTRLWIEALRERVYNLAETRREGKRLRRWVVEGWLLEDHIAEWRGALSPT